MNELRSSVGPPPLHPVPEPGPDLPEDQRRAIETNQRWWQEWSASKGWKESD